MVAEDQKLNAAAKKVLAAATNELFISVVSVWEVVIKNGAGKLRLKTSPEKAVPEWQRTFRLQTLNVTQSHAMGVGDLPLYHQDPFDRMLIAQARAEELVLITADELIVRYPVKTLLCGK